MPPSPPNRSAGNASPNRALDFLENTTPPPIAGPARPGRRRFSQRIPRARPPAQKAPASSIAEFRKKVTSSQSEKSRWRKIKPTAKAQKPKSQPPPQKPTATANRQPPTAQKPKPTAARHSDYPMHAPAEQPFPEAALPERLEKMGSIPRFFLTLRVNPDSDGPAYRTNNEPNSACAFGL